MITREQTVLINEVIEESTTAKLRKRQYEIEMEAQVAQFEAEMEALMAMFDESTEEEAVTAEEITVEEVEIALMSINTYGGYVLDITLDEEAWINENIKISDVLGKRYKSRDKENIIDFLVSELKISKTKAKRLIRNGLGIKRGSEYQNKQREYLADLKEDFNNGLYDELTEYLKKRKLYDFYRGLLEYVNSNISLTPRGINEDDLTFFVIYEDLRKVLKNVGLEIGLSSSSLLSKLEALYELGLIRNLPDEYIDPQALATAYEYSKKASKELNTNIELNRRNFYVLSDLSPEVQATAMNRVAQKTKRGSRVKDTNSTSLALMYGIEEVQNNMMAQADINISEATLRNFIDAANILLEKQGYYTENQLRIQYIKKNHKIKKKDAILLTATYLAGVNMRVGAVRQRVNSKARAQYGVPAKIKSNSIIYVLENF